MAYKRRLEISEETEDCGIVQIVQIIQQTLSASLYVFDSIRAVSVVTESAAGV